MLTQLVAPALLQRCWDTFLSTILPLGWRGANRNRYKKYIKGYQLILMLFFLFCCLSLETTTNVMESCFYHVFVCNVSVFQTSVPDRFQLWCYVARYKARLQSTTLNINNSLKHDVGRGVDPHIFCTCTTCKYAESCQSFWKCHMCLSGLWMELMCLQYRQSSLPQHPYIAQLALTWKFNA